MSLTHYNYMITANPPRSRKDGEAGAVGHHVRLIPTETVTTKQLVEKMNSQVNVLSRGVCLTAIGALAQAVGELLAGGHPVSIEGLGTLQPRLSGTVVEGPRGLVAQGVAVSGVQFTPDAELLAVANQGKAELRRTSKRAMPSEEAVNDFLNAHFARNERLTRKTMMEGLGLTKYQTLHLIQRLVEQGRLQARGYRATAHYVR